jgi:diaminopimelate epimerase
LRREIDKAFPITIFNSDGGEVSACGNGSRCVAYLLGKDLNTKEVKLKTNNRLLNAKIVGHLDVELAMGKPIFEWNKIPLSKNLDHSNITLNIEDKVFSGWFLFKCRKSTYNFFCQRLL